VAGSLVLSFVLSGALASSCLAIVVLSRTAQLSQLKRAPPFWGLCSVQSPGLASQPNWRATQRSVSYAGDWRGAACQKQACDLSVPETYRA
jgi:hypothetical protein